MTSLRTCLFVSAVALSAACSGDSGNPALETFDASVNAGPPSADAAAIAPFDAAELDARVSSPDATTPLDAASATDAVIPSDGAGDVALDGGASCSITPLSPGDHTFTIQSKNGYTYQYILVVPKTLDTTKKAPLVVVWHALMSNPGETRGLTNIDEQGEKNAVLMVHPISPDQAWDNGSCCTGVLAKRDETIFARELIADVSSKACVDEKRIATSGFSNGGMMSQMLACKMADVFRAAAPMGSTLTINPNDCHPSRAVPIFMINGTADPLVGYNSPSLSGGLSVPDTFALWADRNKCKGSPKVTLQKGKVTCRTYDDCQDGMEVTSCAVEGMGHCMPGMKVESPTNCFTKIIPLGMPNDDINGIDTATDFLLKYSNRM